MKCDFVFDSPFVTVSIERSSHFPKFVALVYLPFPVSEETRVFYNSGVVSFVYLAYPVTSLSFPILYDFGLSRFVPCGGLPLYHIQEIFVSV